MKIVPNASPAKVTAIPSGIWPIIGSCLIPFESCCRSAIIIALLPVLRFILDGAVKTSHGPTVTPDCTFEVGSAFEPHQFRDASTVPPAINEFHVPMILLK